MRRKIKFAVAALIGLVACGLLASAADISVVIENLAPARGTWLTPCWVGFHSGGFDNFDLQTPASEELERIAEDGNTAPLSIAFELSEAGASQATISSDPFSPQIAPGELALMSFSLDPLAGTSRYFNFVSMVIPSNDAFLGNDDPMAHPVFDATGNFLGETFTVYGSQVLDAGTEINDEIPENTAFFGQTVSNTGVNENGEVMPHAGHLPLGFNGILDDLMFFGADFTNPDYACARIWIFNRALPKLTLTPVNEIGFLQFPPLGGSFEYSVNILSEGTSERPPDQFEYWITLTDPNGAEVGPVFGPLALSLASGESITLPVLITIPAGYSTGYYLLKSYAGVYNEAVYGGHYFEFQKVAINASEAHSSILQGSVGGQRGSANPAAPRVITDFALLGNKPNPFNPSTAIGYQLSTGSFISLRIYDTTGRLVSELVSGWREAGIHEVSFDGSALASGIYVYRLQAGDFNATGKMILMK